MRDGRAGRIAAAWGRAEFVPLLPSMKQMRHRSCDQIWGFILRKPTSPPPAEGQSSSWDGRSLVGSGSVLNVLALERGWWMLGAAGAVASLCSRFVQSRKTFYFSSVNICTCLAASLLLAARKTLPRPGKITSAGF